jgi:hypothetical protein
MDTGDFDHLALQQIQRLFRRGDCPVWDLVPAPSPDYTAPPPTSAVPIRRADGTIVAYARPAAPALPAAAR